MPGSAEWAPVFGERALALRALAPNPGARGLHGQDLTGGLEVEFDARPVSPRSLDAWRGLPGARLQELAGERIALTLPPEGALALGALSDPDSAILRACASNAQRPRSRVRLMGILNVTPDSFSDGGVHAGTDSAVRHGLSLVQDGAHILDVGGESTRPGALEISEQEEMDRVLPVIEALSKEVQTCLSVDTRKASVASAALALGARMINDVSAGTFDPEMLGLAATHDAQLVLMHMQNSPRDMQASPGYQDVVLEVAEYLRSRVAASLKAGVAASRIAVDPGIGFGKRLKDNLELIRSLGTLRSLGLPIVLGVSRKSFLGRLSGEQDPALRGSETLAAVCAGQRLGADIHRVHDVRAARAALAVHAELHGADPGLAPSQAAPRAGASNAGSGRAPLLPASEEGL